MDPLPRRQSMRRRLGLLRSLLMYYGRPDRTRRMARFYCQFMAPGDLCFDIGAHVGSRVRLWTGLGMRVIAVEPQPHLMQLLRRWYGASPQVTLVEEAIGAAPGRQPLFISERTPTVSTLSTRWIEDVRRTDSFARVRWDSAASVPVTTLDDLIARYGEPVFCKIDVEGYELEVLLGLSQPLRALSIEYVPAARHVAEGCIRRLEALGQYQYNWSVGEQHRRQSPVWVDADAVLGYLAGLPPSAGSGDIYARRLPPAATERAYDTSR